MTEERWAIIPHDDLGFTVEKYDRDRHGPLHGGVKASSRQEALDTHLGIISYEIMQLKKVRRRCYGMLRREIAKSEQMKSC